MIRVKEMCDDRLASIHTRQIPGLETTCFLEQSDVPNPRRITNVHLVGNGDERPRACPYIEIPPKQKSFD